MGILPIGKIFFIDIITAIIGVGILAIVKVEHIRKVEKGEKIDYFKDIREGISYVKNHQFIRTFLRFYAYLSFFIGPISFLTPLMVVRLFGEEVWRLTANEMVFFVGSIIGGAIISVWGGFKNKVNTVAFACLLFGFFSIAMGFSTTFIFFLITMGLMGITMPFFNSPSIVILQEIVEESMQGRIFSIVQIIGSGIMPLSMIIYGPLADIFNIEILIIMAGIIFILLGIGLIYNKNLKEYKILTNEEE